MRNALIHTAFAAAALIGGASHARANAFQDFNLIARGNLTGSSDVHGRTIVYGDVDGGDKALTFANDFSLFSSTVTTPGLRPNDGLIVDGQIKSEINLNGSNARITSPQGVFLSTNATYNDGDVQKIRDSVEADVQQFAGFLASLSSNSDYDKPTSTFSTWVNAGDVAVFEVNASDLFADNLDLKLEDSNRQALGGEADAYIIKVHDDSADDNKTFEGSRSTKIFQNSSIPGKVIFDFSEFTSVTFHTELKASVFAPNAAINLNSSGNGITGTVVGKNIKLDAEIHIGPPPPMVPQPTPASLAALGLLATGGLTLLRRRRPDAPGL